MILHILMIPLVFLPFMLSPITCVFLPHMETILHLWQLFSFFVNTFSLSA